MAVVVAVVVVMMVVVAVTVVVTVVGWIHTNARWQNGGQNVLFLP